MGEIEPEGGTRILQQEARRIRPGFLETEAGWTLRAFPRERTVRTMTIHPGLYLLVGGVVGFLICFIGGWAA